MRTLIGVLAVIPSLLAPAQADELQPTHAHSIDLNGVSGVAYYTIESGAFRIVAVLASGDSHAPVRFESTLEPDQRLEISVPGARGEEAAAIEIIREGDIVSVASPSVALN